MSAMSGVSAPIPEQSHGAESWQRSFREACELVAPVWPLDQWIAVNPFWGMRHLPAEQADDIFRERGGFSLLMPAAFYREAWQQGRIQPEDLAASVAERGERRDPSWYLEWLDRASVLRPHKPEKSHAGVTMSILDTFKGDGTAEPLGQIVNDQVARVCGAFFDRRQARWSAGEHSPGESAGLFEFWLNSVRQDLSLDFTTGLAGVRTFFRAVPDDRNQAVSQATEALRLPDDELLALCHSLLLQVNGWASWCRGLDWRGALNGRASDQLGELLAVLLMWEAAALRFASVVQKNQLERSRSGHGLRQQDRRPLWVWQRAFECGYQRTLFSALKNRTNNSQAPEPPPAIPDAQAVFCIDVRSEVIRRHLEAVMPRVQTLGFAGFFGMPVAHQRHGPFEPVRRLPGLLQAPYRLIDTRGNLRADLAENRARDQREITRETVRKAKYSSLSTFTLVETTGLAWAWKLIKDTLKRGRSRPRPDDQETLLVHELGGDPLMDPEKTALVANMLRGMSLTDGFAPLLVFVGHGSHTDNNPHQAGLECGACGGQSGGVSARLAAKLFNDPMVRAGLSEQGIRIPDHTWAVAAEHCTVTDRVTFAGRDRVPHTHLQKLADLEAGFGQAGARARNERAEFLRLGEGQENGESDSLTAAMETRTRDWSEVRPEWGLAGNAAIIFARRSRTRGCDLAGRVFLHDYDPVSDEDGQRLESLLAAPLLVANWINLQYFGSVTVPDVYGAGNKLLHSVVGGNVGVVEGNGSDLRTGLPLQSVHDGSRWRHEPLRLTVIIDAPADRIEAAIGRQPDVAALVDNAWLFIHRMGDHGIERYHNGAWHPVA